LLFTSKVSIISGLKKEAKNMSKELIETIKNLSAERNISQDVFYSAIEEALLSVAARYFDPNAEIKVQIDKNLGKINVYTKKLVVKEVQDPSGEIAWKESLKYNPCAKEGDEIEIYLPGETLGRIAAQAARQIIMQKVLKAEQRNIYNKYESMVNTLMSGQIRRIEKNNVILDLELGEAIIPFKELSPKDSFSRGDIVNFYIKRVFPEGKGPLVLGTRIMKEFIFELLKREVPEVSDGIVKIFSIAREPGIKSKIAVYSVEKNVDPVGSIVGMNGNRVLSITKELHGERIDVIAWSNLPERFISSALVPGEVKKVKIVDFKNMKAEVTVSDNSLAAAIGRKGVNIKLASKLTKWNIQLTNNYESEESIVEKKL
jgi:N utilization substance protein A